MTAQNVVEMVTDGGAHAKYQLPEKWPQGLLIDGEWGAASTGQVLPVFDPTTEQKIGDVPAGDATDIDRAVAAARQAFESGVWTDLGATERSKILWRAADLIDAEATAIAHVETLNNGMLQSMAIGTVGTAADAFRYYAGAINKIHGLTTEMSAAGREFHAYTLREPVGVAGLIVPWNGPFVLAAFKVATALAAGCTCVLKPAEETPFTALKLGEILQKAGLPAGVLNIVTGLGEFAGAALAAHPDVDKISFTGSTEVGRLIVKAAAGNLKKVSLELGGKSPIVIFDDADLDAAIEGAAMGIFLNAGQICMAGSRVFVQRGAYDRVVSGLKLAARNVVLGSGFSPESTMGPLISGKQRDRVLRLIDDGRRDGGTVASGGQPGAPVGYFVQPTVLTDLPSHSRPLREEIFGPVVTVIPFDGIDDVAAMANDTEFGLAAGVWTRDVSKAHKVAKRIRAGMLWINCQMASDLSLPYGGYKQSGWGRETGLEGLDPFLQTKTVYAAL